MNKKRLLNRRERAYIIEKLTEFEVYESEFGKLSKDEEEELIKSIVGKIQAPQDLEEDN